jgi:hypothetical protein
MSTEAEEIQRIVSASVRDMLDTYRFQALAGPVPTRHLRKSSFGRRTASSTAWWPTLARNGSRSCRASCAFC